tara:strand:- start:721 stop:1269 length:549 start_codon:yes stop_codon:yes gene_type:complete
MLQTIKFINSLKVEKLLFFGVGNPSMFFDRIKGDKKGIDKYDTSLFPRSWVYPVKNGDVQSKNTKKKFDLIVINDSKHYKDLDLYFKQSLKNLNEGGKIIFTHSMPKLPIHETENPKPFQTWCGYVREYVMELISKGGYKVTSFEYDLGVSVIEIDETKQPKEIEIGLFEDWYYQRKELMNN